MPSQYPVALDNLPANFAGTDQADVVDHAGMHNAERDAINALQAELGTDPSGAAATVKARLDAVDADGRWTDTRTPTDGTVSTAKLIDGAVTVAKLTGAYGAKTAAYTITTADSVIAADTTSGAFALTLPAASASTGKTLRIIKTGGANVLTVQRAGSDTILPSSGARTSVAFPSDCAMGEMLLCSNGSAWHVVSGQASDETVGSRLYKWSQALASTGTGSSVGWKALTATGTGAPESVITAAPGSTWLQTDSTTTDSGWLRWVKKSGTGSTGWVAGPEADTGWRDVSSLVTPGSGTTLQALRIRRIGSGVFIAASWNQDATPPTAMSLTQPVGFRNMTGINFSESIWSANTYVGAIYSVDGAGSLEVQPVANQAVRLGGGTISYVCTDAWPTSLPGA